MREYSRTLPASSCGSGNLRTADELQRDLDDLRAQFDQLVMEALSIAASSGGRGECNRANVFRILALETENSTAMALKCRQLSSYNKAIRQELTALSTPTKSSVDSPERLLEDLKIAMLDLVRSSAYLGLFLGLALRDMDAISACAGQLYRSLPPPRGVDDVLSTTKNRSLWTHQREIVLSVLVVYAAFFDPDRFVHLAAMGDFALVPLIMSSHQLLLNMAFDLATLVAQEQEHLALRYLTRTADTSLSEGLVAGLDFLAGLDAVMIMVQLGISFRTQKDVAASFLQSAPPRRPIQSEMAGGPPEDLHTAAIAQRLFGDFILQP